METVYVFWRGVEDDFLCTRLDLEEGMISTLNNNQVVQMCFDAEYPDEVNPFVGDDCEPYDLIEIVGGSPIFYSIG